MTAADDTLAAKKRIMFIKGEDFNYLTYHILVILDSLDCYSAAHAFKDHRKLAYLVGLVSSPAIPGMLVRAQRLHSKLSHRDIHLLATVYANGASRKHLVARLVSTLSKRGLISAQQGEKDMELHIWLNKERIPASFITSDLYEVERNNLKSLLSVSSRIRTLTLDTFLHRFFGDHGVHIWHS